MTVVPAAIGVRIAQGNVSYMVLVADGSKLATFLPLPPVEANSDMVQVFANSSDTGVTNFFGALQK